MRSLILEKGLLPLVSALTTPHPVDRYLELVRPSWSLAEVRAEVTAVRRVANSVVLTLRANSNWRGFSAGQFARVSVEIDGVRRTRCYSLSCSAHAPRGRLELAIRVHDDGFVSRHLYRHARSGMVLGLSHADGDFTLSDKRPDQVLLISGGSGITPVMSMLRTLSDEGYAGTVTFLHYSPRARDVIYARELEELAGRHPYGSVRVIHAHTRERAGAQLSGHFSREHLLAAAPGYARAETFVCGPPALIDAVREVWQTEDLDARLHVEHFVPPAPAAVLGEAKGSVHFARSEREAPNSGAPLLEQAEAVGLTPESGCRMGICHSCTCRKVMGSVRNVRTGEISSDPDEDIQICISVPVGDVQLDI